MSRAFEAQYPGTCVDCDERFEAKTLITISDAGPHHVECPDPEPMVKREVCPRCFTEKSVSGSCACEDDE